MKQNIFICTLLLSASVYAEEIKEIQVQPVFFEQNEPVKEMPSEIETKTAQPEVSRVAPQGEDSASRISRAVIQKDWAALPDLLANYRNDPNADQTLIDYADGARLRAAGKQKEAIAAYRRIASEKLPFVQFDLALMLAEDKQFRESARILERLERNPEAAALHQVAVRYRRSLEEAQAWQPSVGFNFENTDNVNNAADAKTIDWNGRQWRKTEDSLPKSAHGLRYQAGIERTVNLGGNHFARAELNGSGVHYWDAQDFSEQTLQIGAGYRNRSIRQDWGIVPFAAQNWLGGNRYNRTEGALLDYSRTLDKNWRAGAYAQYSRKHYRDPSLAKRYDGHTVSFGGNASRKLAGNALIYGGLDASNDNTHDRTQASWRYGARIGAVKQFSDGIGLRAGIGYTRREFKAPNTLVYRLTRRDHEYSANAALWHTKLSWKGFTPQLNFRYRKIDSNMPGFYSRQNREWFVSAEKQF